MSHTNPKLTCKTCQHFRPTKKDEGKCKQFPNFIAKEKGKCGYFKEKYGVEVDRIESKEAKVTINNL